MGRKRREPKDDKDAKELERLRKNQAACRQRKLDKCDEYKKVIDSLENNIHRKFRAADDYIQKINELRQQLEMARNMNYGGDQQLFNIFQRIQAIQGDIQQMKNNVNPPQTDGSSPSTSRFSSN